MTPLVRRAAAIGALAAMLAGCATTATPTAGQPAQTQAGSQAGPQAVAKTEKPAALPPGLDPDADADPFPSTYKPLPNHPVAIVGAHIFTGTGAEYASGVVLIKDGKIEAVGETLTPPAGYEVIDAHGEWVTPGIIDVHSHLGVYASPAVWANSDGNEATDPDTAQVWAEHSVWPQDPGFNTARRGGVTTIEILPGSANLFGGRSVVLRDVPGRTVQDMKFPGAPYGLKMACGENPKRVYGSKGRAPSTNMGNVAGYRAAWIRAAEYEHKWDEYHAKIARGEKAEPPQRDLQLDTLVGVLKGKILVQNHCYRADQMAQMIDISKEFGYRVTSFHHAVEAYKVADLLKANDVCATVWTNWGGFKMEGYDAIEENAAMLHKAGACITLHSDDQNVIQRLNQETAEALSAGRRAGIDIPEREAIEWITRNPAKVLGVLDQTGTLEPGKRADVVIWNKDPFSVYALTQKVFVDGGLAYDRHDPKFQPKSDFMLGQPGEGTR